MNTQPQEVQLNATIRKVLIVDDEETIRNLLSEKIIDMGFECETARDGLECLEKIRAGNSYDLILLDVQMPNLNGIDTLKMLKQINESMSVVVISASREIDDVKSALTLGAYDYIFKPFNIFDVESVVNRALERTDLIKQNRDYQENLEKKVIKQTRELVRLYSGALEAMVMALELREKETGFHSYRVTEYSLTLARKMGIREPELSAIAKGALLHDIGKIGVPDEILLKPGKLSEDEWEMMKRHPVLGYELIKKIDFLHDSAEIVLHHHEHYDGKGYPDGLARDEIPIGARIFSVVDALDAMTSDRVYREAYSFEKAAEIIIQESGRQFDPEVVQAFEETGLDEFRSIRRNIDKMSVDFLTKLMYNLTKL